MLKLTKVRDLRDSSDMNLKRAGILLYAWIDDIPYYCFGIDRQHSDLSDFGGQMDPGDKDILHTAVREFNEESRRMLGFTLEVDDILDCPCVHDGSTLLIALEVGGDKGVIEMINDSFTDMRYILKNGGLFKRNTSLEMRGLCWISSSDLNIILCNKNQPGEATSSLKSVIFSPNSSVFYVRIYDVIAKFLRDPECISSLNL